MFFPYDLSVLIGPPTAPERFMYTERTKSTITLDWKPPRSDGGSPILGYIVEKRRHDAKDYERVNTRLCPTTSLLVEKLDELHMYEFRVKAVNAIGESEPSLPLNVVIQDDEGIPALKRSIQISPKTAIHFLFHLSLLCPFVCVCVCAFQCLQL